jgi:large subunit ribosomal protein L17
MRHRKSGVKLNRTTSHRQAMFRNMVTSLLKHDRIKTTEAKAKELRRWADHIVTLAKRGDLHARRMAMAIVRDKDVVHKIFEEATDRFGAINGGYTRIVKIGRRAGDAAAMTLVELVSSDDVKPIKKTKTETKVVKKPAAAIEATETDSATDGNKTPAVEKTSTEVEAAGVAAVDSESPATEAGDDPTEISKATSAPSETEK